MPTHHPPSDRWFHYHTETHFDELDAQWILHHSRQIRAVERAQQKLVDRLLQADAFDPVRYPDIHVVVRKLEVDYLKPLQGVRPYDVRLRIVRLRECALVTEFLLCSVDSAEIYTRGLRTVCKLSLKTGTPTGWTARFREQVECWMAGGPCEAPHPS